MKKTLLSILSLFLFLIASAIAIPFIFKDKIAARIDQEIAQSVNAQVIYNLSDISLSVFRSFPDISANVKNFRIVGNTPFQNDTLARLDELQIDFNLKSVLFDEYPTLTGLHLNGGSIYVKVLADGKANYDITYPSEESTPAEESTMKIGVDKIEINDLNLVYDDRQLDYFMALGGINAVGNGEFTTDIYELPLEMEALIADITYEGTSYLSNKTFSGETLLNIDMENMKFTLSEGNFMLNEFNFALAGFLAMPSDDIELDINFEGKDNEFKSLLSLMPGIYSESFSSLETSGTMDFNGFVKGTYNDIKFPAFDVSLKVADGMFQYPELPRPVKNINLDLQVKNETDNLDNTSIAVPAFNLDFGSNPISGKLYLSDLVSYTIDAAIKGKLNLEELTSIFPIEGINLKGSLDINALAKGRYDSIANVIPTIDAKLTLVNGYAKNADYPAPIENLNVNALIQNKTGKMNDFLVNLSQFGFELEDEKIQGNMLISDFEKLIWDGEIAGAVDLKKILAIFPIEDMIMEGRVQADILTKGSYAAVEAGKYQQLQTSGKMEITNFKYSSADVPQGVEISKAIAGFSPASISLTEFNSILGESPVQARGSLTNYMDYFLSEKGILKGQIALTSPRFNVNEWMSENASPDTVSSEMTLIALPNNIDFVMTVAANEVLYDNMNLKEIKGNMTLRDGVLNFSDASMKTLGGSIGLNGSYDPRDLSTPKFNFNLNIADLSIAEAFKSFNSVKAFAPIAQNLTGKFNSTLSFSGKLGQDMMPLLSSLDGSGLLKVAETALKDSKILEGITSLTKLKDVNTLQLKNISIPISIKNGVMDVKPFDVKLWDYEANVQGSAGFDGSINYLVNMNIPAGKFGSQANSILATISGSKADENTMIPVALNLSGTYNAPKIAFAGGNSIEALLTNALKARVSGETQAIQTKATEKFNAVQDSIKKEMKLKAELVQDSVKKELEKQTKLTKDKAAEEAKKLLKGLFTKPKETTKPDTTKVDNN